MMNAGLILIPVALITGAAQSISAQDRRVIDMHLHAHLLSEAERPEPLTGLRAPESTEAVQELTIRAMDEFGVVLAVVSGVRAREYQTAAPERFLVGTPVGPAPIDQVREWFMTGRYQLIAELPMQYRGIKPDDPRAEPLFALAEELDIPVGIHLGPGPPGAAYGAQPLYRMADSNPLALEEVLIRHPNMRLYVMHAGWPFLDELVGLLYAHPQVYVDIAVIDWVLPRPEFHRYLRRIVEAGFSDRVMFGTDQMVWPQAIGLAIDAVESADFLSKEQKQNIFCDNAARFLRLSDSICH